MDFEKWFWTKLWCLAWNLSRWNRRKLWRWWFERLVVRKLRPSGVGYCYKLQRGWPLYPNWFSICQDVLWYNSFEVFCFIFKCILSSYHFSPLELYIGRRVCSCYNISAARTSKCRRLKGHHLQKFMKRRFCFVLHLIFRRQFNQNTFRPTNWVGCLQVQSHN